MNILFTGATGNLGRYVLDVLSSKYNCFAVVRDSSNIKQLKTLGIPYCSLHDITTKFAYLKFDVVIHLAGCYGRNGESVEQLEQSNILFPATLLEVVNNPSLCWINIDTSLPKFLTPYSITKGIFVDILKSKCKNVLNIKLEMFYGLSDNKFIHNTVLSLLNNDEVINLSVGNQLRDIIHVYDIVSAFDVLLQHIEKMKKFKYLDIPLGSGEAISIKDIVLYLKDCTHSHSYLNFGAVPLRDGEPRVLQADLSVLCNLGFVPKYKIKEGLRYFVTQCINK